MSETTLYQDEIVAAARAATGAGRLNNADASAMVDNPLCGDRVTIDVRLMGGRVEAIGHEVRGCVLCEAAASLIGEYAPGESPAALRDAAAAARNLVTAGADAPAGRWEVLSMFAPVHQYKSRYDCVQLPFDALIQAVDSVE